MPIPKINPEMLAKEENGGLNMGVLTAVIHATATMDPAVLAFFADRVPERGSKLWDRFRAGQKEHPGSGFSDFILGVVHQDLARLLLPRVCMLNDSVRAILVSRSQEALLRAGARTDADLFGVYFGDGPMYEAVRTAACKGCHQKQCPIWRR
jgi:hypothetical protein